MSTPDDTGTAAAKVITAPRGRHPYQELLIACLVLVLLCVVSYMCLQYATLAAKNARNAQVLDRFCGGGGGTDCGNTTSVPTRLDTIRNMDHAVTCGRMPSIESVCGAGNGNCCGVYGVPV